MLEGCRVEGPSFMLASLRPHTWLSRTLAGRWVGYLGGSRIAGKHLEQLSLACFPTTSWFERLSGALVSRHEAICPL